MKRLLKEAVVEEKTGKSLISIDIDQTDIQLEKKKDMEVGRSTAKAL